MGAERRRYKRYSVTGESEFWTESAKTSTQLLDVGHGGVLLRSEVVPAQGTQLGVRFAVDGYPERFEARGRVVRTQMDIVAVMFPEEPAGLRQMLIWLDEQEQAKTGTSLNGHPQARSG